MISEAILHNTQGLSLVLHDPLLVQTVRDQVDFVMLDCAARPCDTQTLTLLQNAVGETTFFVRPADTSKGNLQGLLNLGVDGLVLTDVHYASELEKIIAACLYPPEGIRPYRPIVPQQKIMLEAINDQITFIIEVAHPQTVAQLEEIAEVTGVNGFLVCPERLAVALEKGGDINHPAVIHAMQMIARVASSYDIPWGIEGFSTENNPYNLQPNFTIPGCDLDLFATGKAEVFGEKKEAFPDTNEDAMPFTLAASRE